MNVFYAIVSEAMDAEFRSYLADNKVKILYDYKPVFGSGSDIGAWPTVPPRRLVVDPDRSLRRLDIVLQDNSIVLEPVEDEPSKIRIGVINSSVERVESQGIDIAAPGTNPVEEIKERIRGFIAGRLKRWGEDSTFRTTAIKALSGEFRSHLKSSRASLFYYHQGPDGWGEYYQELQTSFLNKFDIFSADDRRITFEPEMDKDLVESGKIAVVTFDYSGTIAKTGGIDAVARDQAEVIREHIRDFITSRTGS